MTETHFNPAEFLDDAEWVTTPGAGRPSKDSIYLPFVQHVADLPAVTEDGKSPAKSFEIVLDGKDVETRAKSLTYHKNQLAKAGTQVNGSPVTVQIQFGDVNQKTGKVKVTFRTRPKITHAKASE